ncbi:hypothetical protein LV84_03597 [Algoriphagus ratkowskyi]|uniref:Uncharacterized protein n=1 Tax=Algoriphagus ratkowskyi TaxID=57028 RepID=A0A2W7RCF1_9BACT|nr:hypothetical protein LV84_03597 [Algoriphagus ratkowskyi]
MAGFCCLRLFSYITTVLFIALSARHSASTAVKLIISAHLPYLQEDRINALIQLKP